MVRPEEVIGLINLKHRHFGFSGICMDAARSQLVDIQVATAADGTYALTGHSAKQFSAGEEGFGLRLHLRVRAVSGVVEDGGVGL